MKEVINLVSGKKTEKRVINSTDGKKQTKKSINFVYDRKYPLLNMYKLMQVDLAP
ncbi:hypothetical protein, partial [Plasmodium yoelii yoelii]